MTAIPLTPMPTEPEETPATSVAGGLDISRIRRSQDTPGVLKPVIQNISLGKPNAQSHVFIFPDLDLRAAVSLIEMKGDGFETTSYLIYDDVVDQIGQPVGMKRRLVVTLARRNGKCFLWPMPSAGRGGGNAWFDTASQIVTNHCGKWVKIAASEMGEGYDLWEVTAPIAVPPKPPKEIYGLLGDAFRGRIIDSRDHPILKTLLGEA